MATEDRQLKGNHLDTFQVQDVDILDSYFEYEAGLCNINVKGRLRKSISFWKSIGTSDFIIDVIENGYKIPLVSQPESVFLRNNKSAREHSNFVDCAIADLVQGGLVKEVHYKPHVVNPLSVSVNSKGKERLILDLRHVNKHVVLNKIKFEDWRTVAQYISAGCYGFTFDLKAGYHHLDIFHTFQQYLGFSWIKDNEVRFYMFTVLPFGLNSSGYIFTKVVRQLVKHWRLNNIKIVVYLDDGFGVAENFETCSKHAEKVKSDIVASGFVPNKDKCVWNPAQSLVWLGFVWNLVQCRLFIPESKLCDIKSFLESVMNSGSRVKIRYLAKVCGKLISLTPAIGNVSQIMTRCIFSVINQRENWDQYVNIRLYPDCMNELLFWKQNVSILKSVDLLQKSSEFHVFTDASDTGAAGFVRNSDLIMHKMWLQNEKVKSSTWREIKAIQLCLRSFSHFLKNSSVTFYTDNQNAVSIAQKGSKIKDLQYIALDIFNCCISENISFYIKWIPRSENERADFLSRIIDVDDWGISVDFFDFLDDLWGPHSYDRFANMDNTKLPLFSSLYWNPRASGIDAFTCHWANHNNWLVPPIALVPRCINHLVKCKASGTLVVPKWPSAAFWPLIFADGLSYKPYVLDVLEFHETNRILVAGNNPNSLFGSGRFRGTILAVRLDASDLN